MTEKDLPALTIADLQLLLRRREVSAREVIDALRARIEAIDPAIGAYLWLDVEAAAREAENSNVDLPLGGVPLAIKDIINVMGQPCTCGSKILQSYRATYDATVIRKLRAAGAIPFGKTNLDEFAMGSSTENSAMKMTRNPWDLSRVPGGSSGGSAAAVAANAAFGALGSDTGGSIRQPAALSGIVGVKPSYGRVSRFGLVAFASSLDQIGPLTKTVRDAALIMNAIAGHDAQDTTALNEPVPDYTVSLGHDLGGVRLGLPKEYLTEGIDSRPEVKRRIILGTYVLGSGYYDAYYLRAQKVRGLIREDFARAFEKVDALISPTSPVPAFKLGERVADPLQMYLADIFTIAANLAGNCGISVPCGFAEVDGHRLPIGLQLLGKALDEGRILQIAHAYEQSTDWHKACPPIAAAA